MVEIFSVYLVKDAIEILGYNSAGVGSGILDIFYRSK